MGVLYINEMGSNRNSGVLLHCNSTSLLALDSISAKFVLYRLYLHLVSLWHNFLMRCIRTMDHGINLSRLKSCHLETIRFKFHQLYNVLYILPIKLTTFSPVFLTVEEVWISFIRHSIFLICCSYSSFISSQLFRWI